MSAREALEFLDKTIDNATTFPHAWSGDDVRSFLTEMRSHSVAGVAEVDVLRAELADARLQSEIAAITTIDWDGFLAEHPELGDLFGTYRPGLIVCGGFPCQDVSLAGLRAGLRDGTRSGLWSEFARAIDALRPELVVIENVRGLLSAKADRGVESDPWGLGEGDGGPALRALGAVLGDLADLGYDARWCGVRAADAGAPHARYRVFIVAYPSGSRPSVVYDKFSGSAATRRGGVRESSRRDWVPPLADAEHLDGYRGGRAWHGWPELADGSAANTTGGGRDGWAQDEIREALGAVATAGGGGASGALANAHGGDERRRNAGLMGSTAGSGESPKNEWERDGDAAADRAAATQAWGAYEPAIRRWEHVLGRVAPAPTEPSGKGGAERLSPRFVEWMMGLPEGWVGGESVPQWRARLASRQAGLDVMPVGMRGSVRRWGPLLSRTQQLKALGNGVVPQQATLAVSALLLEEVAA